MSATLSTSQREPLVSVLMVNCNHADTIGQALESVLAQTVTDLQVIVVDDGSTDDSCRVVEAIAARDPRVELHRLERNVHICRATNFGFSKVRGEWLARIDSDDLWYPTRLERQMAALREHPGIDVCFSWADWIDERGELINDLAGDLMSLTDVTLSTQREWLRRFYYHGNCLLHSSVLMRSAVMRETGGFELTYRQLHDFDYWVRIAKRRNLLVVPERLIAMRRFVGARDQGRNASEESEDNVTRTFNEYLDIRAHLFDDLPDQVFVDAFGEDFVRGDSRTPDELACERALLLCRPQLEWDVPVAPAGLRALKALLAQERTRRLLEERYDFPVQRFYALTTAHLYNDPLLRTRFSMEKDALYAAIDTLNGEIETLRGHVRDLEALVGEKDRELAGLRGRIGELEGSTSWKVTRPLRALSSLARGGRRADAGRAADGRGTDAPGAVATAVATAVESGREPSGPRVFAHAFLAGNLGDDLFVRMLCARYPDVSFSVVAPEGYAGRFADVGNLTVHDPSDFSDLVRSSDAVAHIGGCCFVQHADDFSDFLAADTFLADNARHLFFIGGNFGPYSDPAYLDAYRKLFRRYDGVTFRDRYSADLFAGYPNVAYAPDIIFGYPARRTERRRRVVVSPISFVGRTGKNGIEQYGGAYHRLMLGMVRALAARGYEVSLVSFCQGQGDEDEVARILEDLEPEWRGAVRTAFYRTAPDEVVREFEGAECVVATRFHAMVLGFAHGCRVMPVVYDQKTRKVLDDLAFEGGVELDELADADPERCVDALLRTDPIDVAPLAEASTGHFRFLDALLGR